MYTRRAFLLCLAFLLTPLSAQAVTVGATISGRVVSVHDGDTLTVLSGSIQHRVRLADIDAPERPGQPFSEASRQALSRAVAGKIVTIQITDIDRYDRPVGRVFVGSINVNREMVRMGMAWCNTRYNRDPAMPDIERYARSARLGLWQDPRPVAPWTWRAARRAAQQ